MLVLTSVRRHTLALNDMPRTSGKKAGWVKENMRLVQRGNPYKILYYSISLFFHAHSLKKVKVKKNAMDFFSKYFVLNVGTKPTCHPFDSTVRKGCKKTFQGTGISGEEHDRVL